MMIRLNANNLDSGTGVDGVPEQFEETPADEKYRTHKDFEEDAKRMLGDYVRLGHCEGGPFEATGRSFVPSCTPCYA